MGCMPAQASPLLSTKLNRPPVPADWVDRPRLIEQLNHSLQQGSLTLVCASAGFGKTTLVSSWIEGLTASQRPPTPAAWLSLDESDSDLVVFLRYFVAAIRTVFPESCTESLALLQASQPVAQMPLVAALGNELEVEVWGEKEVTEYYMYKVSVSYHLWESKEVPMVINGKHTKLMQGRMEIRINGEVITDWQKRYKSDVTTHKLMETFMNKLLFKNERDMLHVDPFDKDLHVLEGEIKKFLKIEY